MRKFIPSTALPIPMVGMGKAYSGLKVALNTLGKRIWGGRFFDPHQNILIIKSINYG